MSVENVIFGDFFALKDNGSDVNTGICVKTRSYRQTENISLDSEQNRYYLMKITEILKFMANSQIHKTPWSYETDSWVDVTSVTFNSKNIHEDKSFNRQNILQFFSGVSKDYKYVKCPNMR